ncbi:MAG: metalloregulator ArsR/SmtB family transcription factor [Methanomassiliicoccales archaeon]|nr:metalloregulator ArsR/SmtB family transcription factor [Methanomassiliicoccales archaeon]
MVAEEEKKMEIPDPIRQSLEEIGGLEGISSSLPSDEEILRVSKTFHAISDPLRVKILLILRKQPLCVCLIKALTSVQDSKLSYHLAILKDAGLIIGKQEANWIIYSVTEFGEKLLSALPSIFHEEADLNRSRE